MDESPIQLLFRQFGPLFFVLLLTFLTGMSGDSYNDVYSNHHTHVSNYRYSFTQTY